MIVVNMSMHRETAKEKYTHVPVMSQAVLAYCQPPKGGLFVDGTMGLGGHAQLILERMGPDGRLIGIDRDSQALARARENLGEKARQCRFIQQDFRNIAEILEELGIKEVDGILLDLGVSSLQLDNPDRGFSLRADGPLDMRMDQNSYISAYDLVNSLSEREINAIIRDFGQERYSSRIAHAVVEARNHEPIETTKELRKIILRALPFKRGRQHIHPATRTFQAFRIAVNRELEALSEVLNSCVYFLKKGGRIGVISFHSLEDKIVKEKFRALAKKEEVSILTKKPLRPEGQEADDNPRARSARFRAAERI